MYTVATAEPEKKEEMSNMFWMMRHTASDVSGLTLRFPHVRKLYCDTFLVI